MSCSHSAFRPSRFRASFSPPVSSLLSIHLCLCHTHAASPLPNATKDWTGATRGLARLAAAGAMAVTRPPGAAALPLVLPLSQPPAAARRLQHLAHCLRPSGGSLPHATAVSLSRAAVSPLRARDAGGSGNVAALSSDSGSPPQEDEDDEYGDMADDGEKHVFASHRLENGTELHEVC